MKQSNISSIVKNKLCTSCGVCEACCPKKCIRFIDNDLTVTPMVDEETCVRCGICTQVCPGQGVDLDKMSNQQFHNDNCLYNKYVGYYRDAFVGYSMNYYDRFNSSSGGVLTSFLVYLLEKKIIDGALVVGFEKENPFEPCSYIATSSDQILSSRGSKYIVTSLNKALCELLNFKGKVVIVGLPCQIQGIRKWASKNSIVNNKIIGCFAIYCSLNKTRNSIDYYLQHHNINKNTVDSFSFRGDGCMGYMKFVGDNRLIKKVPYMDYWHGTHSFFTNERCSVCIDHFGELADVCFGDINIPPYNEDKVGINSIIVRSCYWQDLLTKAKEDGVIYISNAPIEDICKSQIYSKIFKKGDGVKMNFLIRSFRGLPNPKYDYIYDGKVSIKTMFKETANMVMRMIGRNRKLWFIIHLLDKSK